MSRKSKFWEYVRGGLENASSYGIIVLLLEAYQYTWKFWTGIGLLAVIYTLHGYELYRANNKEYFNKLGKER